MAQAYLAATANYSLDQFLDNKFPAGSKVQIRTGAPAGCSQAAGGSLLVEITTPATPWAAASGGSKAKNGTWSASATGSGTAGHYRMTNGTDVHEGTVTATGGGGDMELDNTSITATQVVTITAFTRTLPVT